MRYSFVIPALDEAESVAELHGEIVAAMSGRGDPFEIIFVDDGSTDGTARRIELLAESDPRVQLVRFSRNFGKSAAYAAGFDHADGEIIITLDADLQDDPAEAPKLIDRLEEGFDLVVGWKMGRLRNEPTKTLPSRVFNGLKNRLFGLHLRDSNSGYRAMVRSVAESLHLYGDNYRFIPELAHQFGFRVSEVGVDHRPRRHGSSKYGARRFWTGILDLLAVRITTAYMHKPLHFFGSAGLLPVLLGAGLETYVLVCKLMGHPFREHVAAIIIGALLITVGVQLIAIGLVGEIIIERHPRRRYVIAQLVGGSREHPDGGPAQRPTSPRGRATASSDSPSGTGSRASARSS